MQASVLAPGSVFSQFMSNHSQLKLSFLIYKQKFQPIIQHIENAFNVEYGG